jgi:hypothetical protein
MRGWGQLLSVEVGDDNEQICIVLVIVVFGLL